MSYPFRLPSPPGLPLGRSRQPGRILGPADGTGPILGGSSRRAGRARSGQRGDVDGHHPQGTVRRPHQFPRPFRFREKQKIPRPARAGLSDVGDYPPESIWKSCQNSAHPTPASICWSALPGNCGTTPTKTTKFPPSNPESTGSATLFWTPPGPRWSKDGNA